MRSRSVAPSLALFAFLPALAALSVLAGCAPGSGADLGVTADALRVCADSDTVLGVDVSFYQGAVDWAQIGAAGFAFAFARVSDGLVHADPQFKSNWAGIHAAGLVRGAYQYFEPGEDVAAQADLVVENVGVLGASELPAVIDVEDAGGQSPGAIAAGVRVWVDRVTAGTGKTPIVYTAKYFWNADVGATELADAPLWVADYGVTCPDLPDGWGAWQFWQFGYHSNVAGVNGDIDVDRFNGSTDALRAFAEGAAATLPTDPRAGSKTTPSERSSAAAPVDAGAALGANSVCQDAGKASFDSGAHDPFASDHDAGRAGTRFGDTRMLPSEPTAKRARTTSRSSGCDVANPSRDRSQIWCWFAFVSCLARTRIQKRRSASWD